MDKSMKAGELPVSNSGWRSIASLKTPRSYLYEPEVHFEEICFLVTTSSRSPFRANFRVADHTGTGSFFYRRVVRISRH